jgi:ATP-dependent Lhr-like helicase
MASETDPSPLGRLERVLYARGWTLLQHQRECATAYLAGRSGLLHAPTGAGKTLAAACGPMIRALEGVATEGSGSSDSLPDRSSRLRGSRADPLQLLWITPMRALATDTAGAIAEFVRMLGLPWSVELRTGDTSSHRRARQRQKLPSVLVTTPESLSVLIGHPQTCRQLSSCECCVVDEWHELLGTKRGTQCELALSFLRFCNPGVRVWGLSATLHNAAAAMQVLIPSGNGVLVCASGREAPELITLIPATMERFPWGGHLGVRLVDDLVRVLEPPGQTLVFTNTRWQAETWYRTIVGRRPDWMKQLAVHHGSLDRAPRRRIEERLRSGELKAVVCTSSLDLGVDLPHVDRVVQVGSPKGVGRLLQRAGRSGHTIHGRSRIVCLPTHAFELVEFSAARWCIQRGSIEAREAPSRPLDVLAQHLVTVACGPGFDECELLQQVRSTWSYAHLTDDEWRWGIEFVSRGGSSLSAYPRFRRVVRQEDGRWHVASAQLARSHRLGIGTITSDAVVTLSGPRGLRIGTIEESFISKLRPGDTFAFGGKTYEFRALREMTALVRPTRRAAGMVPAWAGGRFPMSTELAHAVRCRLAEARRGHFDDDEMRAVRPILELQARWSHLPGPGELLIETIQTRDGYHAFLFPLRGRLMHEGLAALLSRRILRELQCPVTATFTDYGIELLSPNPLDQSEAAWRSLLGSERVAEDLLECLDAGQLMRRQFRDIARIAGLTMVQVPGSPRTARHMQASSDLFFDVFRDFDPENLLLEQARREVMQRALDVHRLVATLEELSNDSIILRAPQRLTPMAFPIWAGRLASQTVRAESAQKRIERMMEQLEAEAER